MSFGTSTRPSRPVSPARPLPLSSQWLASRLAIGVMVTIFATFYVSGFIYRGWVPHDEGLMAQMAERTLAGELPHLHFDEAYTGGLTFIHSLAFYLGGAKLSIIRLSLAVWIPPFVFALYWLLSRQGSTWLAAVTTCCAVVWSVPNYFAALPSWHNLFLWVFGLVALYRFIDTQQRRWLLVAGFCGGTAIAFKITGLYFVAATLIFLAFRQSVLAHKLNEPTDAPRSVVYSLFITLISLTLSALLWLLIRNELAPMEFTLFVVPGVSICLCLMVHEWMVGRGPSGPRFRALFTEVAIFAIGLLPPILLFVFPYVTHDGLPELINGVFIQPHLRMTYERLSAGTLMTLLPALIPTALLLIWGDWGKLRLTVRQQGYATAVVLLVNGWMLLPLKGDGLFYWHYYTVRNLVPTLSILCCAFLLGRGTTGLSLAQRQILFLLAASASFSSLVQFPFSALIYFCYAAPLVILCFHALVEQRKAYPTGLAWAMMGAFFLFGVVANTRYGMEYGSLASQFDQPLELSRAGLLVRRQQEANYKEIIDLVTKHSPEDSPILATPDCPEIYFLANRRNPTRIMFDFFDAKELHDDRMIKLIDTLNIPVVVVNLSPQFSPRVTAKLGTVMNRSYPIRKRIGNFVVCLRTLPEVTSTIDDLAQNYTFESEKPVEPSPSLYESMLRFIAYEADAWHVWSHPTR